jgi:tetratricopeptide (TPR) repeat protein
MTKKAGLFLLFLLMVLNLYPQNKNFDEGLKHLKKEHYQKAVRKFSKHLKENPQNHQALYYRSLACAIKGKKADQSFYDIDEAIRLCQEKAEYYYLRLYINSVAQDTGTVYFDANAAIKLDTSFAEAYYARAKIYAMLWIISFDVKNRLDWCYRQARQDLDKAIELKPNLYQAYAFRAYISEFYNPNNEIDVLGDLNKSIEINSKQRKAYAYRAMTGFINRNNSVLGDLLRAYVFHRKEPMLPIEFLIDKIP